MSEDKSYIGKGIVYIENELGALIDAGNVTAFSYSADQEKVELKNYRTAGGGNRNSIERIDAVTLAMAMSDFNAENLALGLFANVNSHTGGVQTDEAQTAPSDVSADCLIPTDHVVDTAQAMTITGKVEGTDFQKVSGGVLVLATGSIAADEALLITYTSKTVNEAEAFVDAARDRKVVLDGLNEAQGGDPVRITIHRAKFGPAADTGFIADEFGSISVSGEALQDATITTTGLSQYLKIEIA
jgi:hypothetical protein